MLSVCVPRMPVLRRPSEPPVPCVRHASRPIPSPYLFSALSRHQILDLVCDLVGQVIIQNRHIDQGMVPSVTQSQGEPR